MADTDLITDYVTALRSSLRWRCDVDDLVCEVDDHLRCAALGLQARGLDPSSAQRAVLDRFGDAKLVARSFALTATGGTAMPSQLTRTAGVFAIVAAVAWLVAAPVAFIGAGSDDWVVPYFVLNALVFIASVCTTVVIFGMLRRAGGRWDALTVVAMLLAILGTLLLGAATWAWPAGVALVTIAVLIAVLRLRSARLENGLASILLVVGWPIGIAVGLVLGALKVGPVDSYGDYYIAQRIGFATGGILFAAGLLMIGRWLHNEHAVNVADSRAAV